MVPVHLQPPRCSTLSQRTPLPLRHTTTTKRYLTGLLNTKMYVMMLCWNVSDLAESYIGSPETGRITPHRC